MAVLNHSFMFIHGGPGFNGAPERTFFENEITSLGFSSLFWNEPSALRPDGDPFHVENTFAHSVASAEKAFVGLAETSRIILVAHSFGVHVATRIAQKFPERIAGLILVSPGFDNYEAQKNVLRLAQKDFATLNPQISERLKEILFQTQSNLDPALQEGLSYLPQDPLLFSHYFKNPEVMQVWGQILSSPDLQLDPAGFFLTLQSLTLDHLEKQATGEFPVFVLYGENDPVISIEKEMLIVNRLFKNVSVEAVSNSSHYPHLESPQRIMAIIKMIGNQRSK